MGENRDYYADLELPPTADVQEIKKQFRKLALKYHPDRNPGREQEVNAKFQKIQSAHEVLGDPTEKAKYDATSGGSRTSRYPTASGRKGNPWSEAAQNFPPPPRRNAPGKANTSSAAGGGGGGAQRWSTRFSAGVPPTAKQYTSADPETKKNAAKAFDTMRKSQAKKPQPKSSEPPPPPPRTQAGKERAEASFGTRKTSQANRPTVDERDPTYRKPEPEFYNIGVNSNPPMPDPLSQFRDNAADSQYSSQYATHGGEKVNPFAGIHRTHNMTPATDEEYQRTQRHDDMPASAGAYAKSPYKRRPGRSDSADSTRAQPDSDSMYDNLPLNTTPRKDFPHANQSKPDKLSFFGSLSSVYNPQPTALPPSVCASKPQEGPQFEQQLQDLLTRLIDTNNIDTSHPTLHSTATDKSSADNCDNHSFNFKVDDDTFNNSDNNSTAATRDSSPGHPQSFGKKNYDDINTEFGKDFLKSTWSFTAGGITENVTSERTKRTSPVSAQDNIYSPGKPTDAASANDPVFNPGGWSDKFGPQTFIPQQQAAGTASPTRTSRTNSRKSKPAKSNSNNPIVINDSDEEDLYEWPGRKAQGQGQSKESPQAMDIDTPPAVPPRPPPDARTIYVEPTRPEWRSDEAKAAAESSASASNAAGKSSAPHAGGSEDSEEFRASLADLKNVAPFAKPKPGLKSFSELKDNLPFESQASGEVPSQPRKVQQLVFPTPPTAPRLPPTVAVDGIVPTVASWNKYIEDFGMYLQEWELFNTQVVDHFATRNAHIKNLRKSKGYAFLGSRSDGDIQEYMGWVQQDNDVRQRWNAACLDHEERFREFNAFRSKMR